MKLSLVTTTIHVPHALKLFRRFDADVMFYVAVDKNTPEDAINFCRYDVENCYVVYIEDQLQYKIGKYIPFGCIQRRNFATLEALKGGADAVVFWDDDNLGTSSSFFAEYDSVLDPSTSFSGLLADPQIDWFDVGAFLDPPSSHRGFPHQIAGRQPRLSHVVDAKVGACAGIVLGDPDVSAITRITKSPHVLAHSPLLNAGIAVNPKFTRTVFNTQNSAVLREFAPAMLLCPQFKRYDDIIASLVCQRLMASTGHHVLFGPPVVYQERNAHDLGRDLDDEAWGQANILAVQAALWKVTLGDLPILQKIEVLYDALAELMPGVDQLAAAWIEDCERAMS